MVRDIDVRVGLGPVLRCITRFEKTEIRICIIHFVLRFDAREKIFALLAVYPEKLGPECSKK